MLGSRDPLLSLLFPMFVVLQEESSRRRIPRDYCRPASSCSYQWHGKKHRRLSARIYGSVSVVNRPKSPFRRLSMVSVIACSLCYYLLRGLNARRLRLVFISSFLRASECFSECHSLEHTAFAMLSTRVRMMGKASDIAIQG